jgi:transposase
MATTRTVSSKTTLSETVAGPVTIGIDVGDAVSNLCVLDADGQVCAELRVRTTPTALRTQLGRLPTGRVVLEAGSQSPWLSRLVQELGYDCIVANPVKVQLIAKSTQKTDRNDAETLARLGRVDPQLLSPVEHRPPQAQADLAVIRSRKALIAARSLLINQVRGTVKAVGGRLRACDANSFAMRVGEQIPEPVVPALTPLVTVIGTLTAEIKAADARIATLIDERYPAARWLQQVAGVGPLIALTFILTLGDPTRFRTSRAVGPYLGLAPRQRSSGQRAPQLGISKAGDTYLRYLLIQGAHYILGYRGPDTDLRRWGLTKAAASGKKRAVTAVARKLAVLLHRLWVTGARYEPVRPQHDRHCDPTPAPAV